MHIAKRNRNAERDEIKREAQEAQEKRSQAMVEYIAAMDYPEILPDEEPEGEEETENV